METLLPVICDFLNEGKKVIIEAVGNSMHPMIRHKKDSIILKKYDGEELKVSDMAFYKRESGRYVLHRIVDITEDNTYVMLGDNQTTEKEKVTADQIIAVPTTIIRGKKTIPIASKKCRRYSKFWAKSVFFRKLSIKLFGLKIKLFRIIFGKKEAVL